MQVTAPDRDELRRLVEIRLDRPLVLSLYLDLDPTQFATPRARATAVRSLVDLESASLKGLLRRVIAKIFKVEIKGWCSEFEARNATGGAAVTESVG